MQASVVIRAKDEAAAIGRTLGLLAEQTLPHEVIVVDSGSRDRTVAIARDHGAQVLEIPAAGFSFGGALNLGARASSAPVVVSLSAHAFPPDPEWLARTAAWFADTAVACAFGDVRDADGAPLVAPVRQDAAMLRAAPHWGYSNGAGAFRASLWSERGFREDMPGTEDREWSLWAMETHGAVCVIDPALAVEHDHAHDSLRACFARWEREARGYGMFLDLPPYGAGDLVREWWSDQGWHRSRARARLDPRRAARLAGKWRGRR
jgi:glycosyltransferase involved in cell wall biosynthesis